MSKPFTLGRLADLYEMRTEWPHRETFWRHDVDYSLEAAWAMAEFEADRGVQGTYFLMPDNPFYSNHDALALAMLLGSAGHRIGWHVDTRRERIEGLSAAKGVPISFHCPRSYELWKEYDFDCAYGSRWKGLYYSDSRGGFAYGDPEGDHRPVLQINLHPEWWFDPGWHERVDEVAYEDFWYEPKSRLDLVRRIGSSADEYEHSDPTLGEYDSRAQ